MLKLSSNFLLALLTAVFIAGCAGKQRATGLDSADGNGANSSIGNVGVGNSASGDANTNGYPAVGRGGLSSEAQSAAAREAARLAALRGTRVIYFDYDRTDISQRDRDVIAAHAKFLLQNPAKQLTLLGHADERGSREYNIALGQRRADSVKEVFALYGLPQSRIKSISLGEEKPAAFGRDESAWRLNRRVEIQY